MTTQRIVPIGRGPLDEPIAGSVIRFEVIASRPEAAAYRLALDPGSGEVREERLTARYLGPD